MTQMTPQEAAVAATVDAWAALPILRERAAVVRAAVRNHRFDAAGMTAALEAFNAAQAQTPVPDVHEALEQGLVTP